ncbi:hypothetical protein C0971_14645 [Bacillus methanolicus]|uniref:hypothetical protein n=1 Tax=Bacillus methanolicus TaxID=1471 RepID=UPI00200F9A0F|nr:hypothetical protein [Bacillus methanolicus]UQD53125.1 hypothetical protein C0971_14645 [Bacillus methanolicus]
MNGSLKRSLESGEILEMIYLSDKNQLSQRNIKVVDISSNTFRAYCFTPSNQYKQLWMYKKAGPSRF